MAKKKLYSAEEAAQKFKDIYEANVKALKSEHDEFIKGLNIEEAKRQLDEARAGPMATASASAAYEELRVNFAKLEKTKLNAEYKAIALMEAEKLWMASRLASMSEKYHELSDEQKMALVQKDFADFNKSFPIVVKYMVCLGMYDRKCFNKFIELCDRKLTNAPETRDKDYMEEQWIHCQASYVKFLWENSQKKRYTEHEGMKVYKDAYKSIKADFMNFRKLHEEMEKKIKQDDKKFKTELLKEAAGRLIAGKQQIDTADMTKLINKLKDMKYAQNYKRVLAELLDTRDAIAPVIKGAGINEDAQYEYDEELRQAQQKKKLKKLNL